MGIFSKKKVDPNDLSLTDDLWLSAGERRYDAAIGRYYGSPETIASGGFERLADPSAALFFFQKAIDLLHTQYGYLQMKTRQPGDRDETIIDGYLHALRAVRNMRPKAPIAESVREVTHRLRAISSECKSRGRNGGLYLSALDRLGSAAPDVRVDDIFWT